MDSGDTLLTILGDILDFSKIDHNRCVLAHRPAHVLPLILILPLIQPLHKDSQLGIYSMIRRGL